MYVRADRTLDLHERCRALLLAVPDGVLSHHTAAGVLGLPAPSVDVLHLTRPSGRAPVRRGGVVAHVRQLRPDDVLERDGLRVTAPARVFLDLAPTLTRDDLVALGDAAAQRLGLEALGEVVAAAPPRRGLVGARAALRLVHPGADSPAETRLRLLLHDAGLAALTHGVVVRDELARAAGWEVVVLTGRDLRLPHLAVHEVAAAYGRAGAQRC